jgi:hypothetical protein
VVDYLSKVSIGDIADPQGLARPMSTPPANSRFTEMS